MSSASQTQRPNIIFFMLDQLSAKWLEGDAGAACPTPNIDRLCEEGVTFRNAFSSNPVCCPARATLATGLSSRGHGVLQNGYELDPELPTFMKMLQRAGWRTGSFGKVHLHAHYHGLYPDYHPYGYDVVHTTEDPRGGEWLDWIEREYPEHYEAALVTIWPYHIPAFRTYGRDRIDLSSRIEAIRRGFGWATAEHPHSTPGYYTLPFPEPLSQTAWITGHATEFIGHTDPDQPIYAHISYVQPHAPSCPPAVYMDRVDVSRIPEPAPAEWLDEPEAPVCFKRTGFRISSEHWRDRRHYYLADVAHLDHQLGVVIDALKRAGRWEHTYLIFVADHGDLLYDHGFFGKAERHYDACVRVPLMISGPGLSRGLTCDAMVQLEDICPTVLEMAGLSLPLQPARGRLTGKEVPALPGRSLLPWCQGETLGDWRDAVYIESYNNTDSYSPQGWARTIRTGNWRYTL